MNILARGEEIVKMACDLRLERLCWFCRVTGGELFEDIVAREFYSEADARYVRAAASVLRGDRKCAGLGWSGGYFEGEHSQLISSVPWAHWQTKPEENGSLEKTFYGHTPGKKTLTLTRRQSANTVSLGPWVQETNLCIREDKLNVFTKIKPWIVLCDAGRSLALLSVCASFV